MRTLANLSAVFFQALGNVIPDYAQYIAFSDRPEWILPAKHPETGEMHVWVDRDEITIGIGGYFHTHFSTDYFNSDDPRENEKEAAREAVKFIQDVLADKVVICVSARIAGSYYRGSANPPTLKPGTKEYVWSGPFTREERDKQHVVWKKAARVFTLAAVLKRKRNRLS